MNSPLTYQARVLQFEDARSDAAKHRNPRRAATSIRRPAAHLLELLRIRTAGVGSPNRERLVQCGHGG